MTKKKKKETTSGDGGSPANRYLLIPGWSFHTGCKEGVGGVVPGGDEGNETPFRDFWFVRSFAMN